MYSILFLALARLVAFTAGGYLLFRFTPLKERHLKFILFLTMNFFLPVYFIRNFIIGWNGAADAGFGFMVAFFFGSIVFLLLQMLISSQLAPFVIGDKSHRREFILLFSFQNAGYVALPIMESFAPPELMVFMFFWIFGFSLFFWTLSSPLLGNEEGGRKVRINGPIVGIISGFLISLFGFNTMLFPFAQTILAVPSKLGLNLILLTLGGILATIPRGAFRIRRDYIFLILVKLIIYPLLLLFILKPLNPSWIPLFLLVPMKLALILQAAVPPSTNLMIATKQYGSEGQVAYIAAGEMITYPVSVITMPLVLSVSFYILL
jgi:predicted permease